MHHTQSRRLSRRLSLMALLCGTVTTAAAEQQLNLVIHSLDGSVYDQSCTPQPADAGISTSASELQKPVSFHTDIFTSATEIQNVGGKACFIEDSTTVVCAADGEMKDEIIGAFETACGTSPSEIHSDDEDEVGPTELRRATTYWPAQLIVKSPNGVIFNGLCASKDEGVTGAEITKIVGLSPSCSWGQSPYDVAPVITCHTEDFTLDGEVPSTVLPVWKEFCAQTPSFATSYTFPGQ